MTITALPPAPSTNDPSTFDSKADALIAALPTFVTETNAVAVAMNLNSTNDTSTSSVLIGTGAKTFTVTAGKSFQPGMYLVCADAAAPSTNSMYCQITSYSGTTLVVNSLSVAGSGTKTAWVISQSAGGASGFAASGVNTDITSLNAPALGAATATTQAGSDNSTKVANTAQVQLALATVILRSYLAGLTLSTAGSSTTMSIAAGQAADSTNTVMMAIAAFTKTTASWTLGSAGGALDTGTTGGAASTWYYWYLIRRPDTGVVDLVFSLSSAAPTLPTNYTQYRYIGAGKLDGSKNWTAFTQMGREFYWSTPVLDVTQAASTTAGLSTLTIPLGRKVRVHVNIGFENGIAMYISDPANADLTPILPGTITTPLCSAGCYGFVSGSEAWCWTNTSRQIRRRETSAIGNVGIATLGWVDLADTNL